jgi:hypothetical protein
MFEAECTTRSDKVRPSYRDTVNSVPIDPPSTNGLAG